eukprot:6433496-Prymnesium_polylepis.1
MSGRNSASSSGSRSTRSCIVHSCRGLEWGWWAERWWAPVRGCNDASWAHLFASRLGEQRDVQVLLLHILAVLAPLLDGLDHHAVRIVREP